KIEYIFQLNESVFFENDEYIKNSSRAKEGYIVSGHDSATNILSDTELKILLTADFETYTLSIEFIKEIIKLLTIFVIDTIYLSIEEIVDKILLKTSNMISIKNSKPNSKVIVAFGSIGAGKTTFLNKLKDFFENQELKVYFSEEMSLRLGQDLKYFYQDTQRYRFMFQDFLINAY
ncbi:7823_t:CDS:2, partial [Racocetra persica]